jgi:hypothetical protein
MWKGIEVSATEFADKTKASNLGSYHDDMSLTITIV